MAREIVQMYDKYHSTKKVYPKVIEECLPEGISKVVANPDPAGETELNGIQIGDTKYKVGGGNQLYEHHIKLQIGYNYVFTTIISNRSEQYDKASLKTYLSNFSSNLVMATGFKNETIEGTKVTYNIMAIGNSTLSNTDVTLYYYKPSYQDMYNDRVAVSFVSDTVLAL